MRAIRAWHLSANTYIKMFREIAGLSCKDFRALNVYPSGSAFEVTDRLTAMREKLTEIGYAKEVEQTDERFLEEHRGFKSEEAWEDFWKGFCARHNLDLRNDAL